MQIKWKKIPFRALKFIYDVISYPVVLVDGILAVFWYLKEYLLCLIVIKSCKYKGLVLLTILNVSMTIHVVLIRLIFKVGNYGMVAHATVMLVDSFKA
jgi:hypothetical protein